MNEPIENISNNLFQLEERFSVLAKKVIFFRNETVALKKRIELLEKENEMLKSKRDYTVSKLKNLMNKFSEIEF